MWIVKNKNRIIYNSELHHYGVLGMHWGVRKDDYDEDYVAQSIYARHASSMDFNDWLDTKDENISIGVSMPKYVEASERADRIGMDLAFDKKVWESASDEERLSADLYTRTNGCDLMNGLLRGSIDSASISSEYGSDASSLVDQCVDKFSDILSKNLTTRDMITYRATDSNGISKLLGLGEEDLSNKNIVRSLLGERVQDPGFLSTTIIQNAKNTLGKYGDIEVDISVPKGSQAMYLEPATGITKGSRGLYEVCLQRDSIFQFSGVEMDKSGDKIKRIMLDLVGQ